MLGVGWCYIFVSGGVVCSVLLVIPTQSRLEYKWDKIDLNVNIMECFVLSFSFRALAGIISKYVYYHYFALVIKPATLFSISWDPTINIRE